MLSPALRRFTPYLRPSAHLVTLTVLAAVVSLCAATAIPLVIKAVIDGPIGHRRPDQLLPLAAALFGLALIELAANFVRRNYANLAILYWQAGNQDPA